MSSTNVQEPSTNRERTSVDALFKDIIKQRDQEDRQDEHLRQMASLPEDSPLKVIHRMFESGLITADELAVKLQALVARIEPLPPQAVSADLTSPPASS